jgi:hypothetical protein
MFIFIVGAPNNEAFWLHHARPPCQHQLFYWDLYSQWIHTQLEAWALVECFLQVGQDYKKDPSQENMGAPKQGRGSCETSPLWLMFTFPPTSFSFNLFCHNNILCRPCLIHYDSYFFIVANISSSYCSHGMPFQRFYIFSNFGVIPKFKSIMYKKDLLKDWSSTHLEKCS